MISVVPIKQRGVKFADRLLDYRTGFVSGIFAITLLSIMHSLYLLFVGHPSETNYLATDDIKNISTSMKYVPKIQTFHQNSALI